MTKWFYHPTDNSVDVAVAPFWLTPDVEYKTIPVNIFLTDDILTEGKIGIGDETYIVGLFAHVAGSKRNEPMVRIGNLAMIPQELIPTKEFGNVEAYLIEARSIGGLSGCPVFVRESFPVIEKNVFKTTGKHYLLGLMHAHWKLSAESKNDVLSHWDFNEKVNMGIAIVIPAKKIHEVLNHPFLVGLRDQKEKEKIEKSN